MVVQKEILSPLKFKKEKLSAHILQVANENANLLCCQLLVLCTTIVYLNSLKSATIRS